MCWVPNTWNLKTACCPTLSQFPCHKRKNLLSLSSKLATATWEITRRLALVQEGSELKRRLAPAADTAMWDDSSTALIILESAQTQIPSLSQSPLLKGSSKELLNYQTWHPHCNSRARDCPTSIHPQPKKLIHNSCPRSSSSKILIQCTHNLSAFNPRAYYPKPNEQQEVFQSSKHKQTHMRTSVFKAKKLCSTCHPKLLHPTQMLQYPKLLPFNKLMNPLGERSFQTNKNS